MISDTQHLVCVTDASPQIGLGHVMRQLSLTQAARKRGWTVHWLSPSPAVATVAEAHGIRHTLVSTLDEICPILDGYSSLVIDVHQRDFPRLRCAKTENRATLLVSEVGDDFVPYGAHIVFVGSRLHEWFTTDISAQEGREIKLHAGRAWMIFRDEFGSGKAGDLRQDNHVLVCHGGSDPHRLTELSLQALALVERDITITVLITDSFPKPAEIDRFVQSNPHPCAVVHNAKAIRGYMEAASVAVINGGNVRYELCLCGTPYIAVSFQETQYECTEQLSRQGVGVNLGLMTAVTQRTLADAVTNLLDDRNGRQTMEAKMRALFDPLGADRVLDLLYGDGE